MSLVGLDVSFDGPGIDLEPTTNNSESYDGEDDDAPTVIDHHPCVTPPGPAEMLFLSVLPTQRISAAALAQQIHIAHGQRSGVGGLSLGATDEFATAAGSMGSNSPSETFLQDLSPAPTSKGSSPSSKSPFSDSEESDAAGPGAMISYPRNIFPNDVLTRTSYYTKTILLGREQEPDVDDNEEVFQDATMTTPAKKFFPNPSEAPQHVDAAEKVYDTAKQVWAWGKGVGLLQPLLGLAEGVAAKAVIATGNTLDGVDGMVIDQLHGLDDNCLNPAIAAVMGILLKAAGKSEQVIWPILLPFLIRFQLIKMDTTTTTTSTPTPVETPEVTPDFAGPIEY